MTTNPPTSKRSQPKRSSETAYATAASTAVSKLPRLYSVPLTDRLASNDVPFSDFLTPLKPVELLDDVCSLISPPACSAWLATCALDKEGGGGGGRARDALISAASRLNLG